MVLLSTQGLKFLYTNYIITAYFTDYLKLQNELKKQVLIIQQKDKKLELKNERINNLTRIIRLLKNLSVLINLSGF